MTPLKTEILSGKGDGKYIIINQSKNELELSIHDNYGDINKSLSQIQLTHKQATALSTWLQVNLRDWDK